MGEKRREEKRREEIRGEQFGNGQEMASPASSWSEIAAKGALLTRSVHSFSQLVSQPVRALVQILHLLLAQVAKDVNLCPMV